MVDQRLIHRYHARCTNGAWSKRRRRRECGDPRFVAHHIHIESEQRHISEYAFYDAGGGNGHFTVNGVSEPDGQWFYVAASNLGEVDYVGGSSPGSDTLYVEVYDATGSTWSSYSALTAATYDIPPTVKVQNVTVAENAATPVSSLITSISNPSNDTISEYGFYDAGDGNGHFTVNGASEPDSQWIYVAASNLGNVAYVGGSSPGATPSMSRFTTPRDRPGLRTVRSPPPRMTYRQR